MERWTGVANKGQHEPKGPWRTWVFLGGRGAGKTRAGAQAMLLRALPGWRLALVGPTFHDVREVMIDGPAGIRAIAPERLRPRWEASRRRLVWDNGAEAFAFSAEDPESLRGPQFHAAWADEFCAWAKPSEALAMLRFGLRLGADPRLVVTTTPKPTAGLRALLGEPGTARTDARTADNVGNLAPSFVADLRAIYGGTRLEAQELEGMVLDAPEGALFRAEDLLKCRGVRPERLEKVVVAVDPPVSTEGDGCGIVGVGRAGERAYVLADRSGRGMTPAAWARRAAALAEEVGAACIVAEANQGGDMVRSVLAQAEPGCSVKLVHASKGKRARAEPVAALYEQGRVTHCGVFAALEEELMGLGCEDVRASPDRADALVWAVTELMLERRAGPRIRVL
ncbi:MAG TPA: terminase family protein [Caulobacteraceae bacterium]